MNRNNNSEPLAGKNVELQVAIKRAEAEVELVREMIAREGSNSGRSPAPHQPNRAQEGVVPQAHSGSSSEIPKEIFTSLRRIEEEIGGSAVTTRRRFLWGMIAFTLAIAGVIATVIFGIRRNSISVEAVGRRVEESRLVITTPTDGTGVGLGQKVRGKTPFSELNHYVVVTAVRTGTASIEPAFVADGEFNGNARFGDQGIGEDDEFRIRVLATRDTLTKGILTAVPSDAIFSEPVTVRRVLRSPLSSSGIVIHDPVDVAEVGLDEAISGKTNFPGLNHYIVVTPVRIGTAFVQSEAVINPADGTFSGKARFGEVQVAVGEQFVVQVLATKSTLPSAPLTKPPGDAVFSNSVTVRRKQ